MPTITLTQDNFGNVVAANPIVLVDWWTGWCGPCRYFAPVYEASSDQHPEIVHGKIDAEAEAELSAAAGITGYPTLMAFREGILVHSEAGALAADALEDLIQQIRWLDMDQIRRESLGQSATHPLPDAAAGGSAASSGRQAGLAPVPPRYGWPGL